MNITERAKTNFRALCAKFKKDPDTIRTSRTMVGAVWRALPSKIRPADMEIAMRCFDTKNELVDFLSCVAENRTQWPLPTAEQIASASGMTDESATMIHTAMIVKRDRYLVGDEALPGPASKKRKRADDDDDAPPPKREAKPVRYHPRDVWDADRSVQKQLTEIHEKLQQCTLAVDALLSRK